MKVTPTKGTAKMFLTALDYKPKGIIHSHMVEMNDSVRLVWTDYKDRKIKNYYNQKRTYILLVDYKYFCSIIFQYDRIKKLKRILNGEND